MGRRLYTRNVLFSSIQEESRQITIPCCLSIASAQQIIMHSAPFINARDCRSLFCPNGEGITSDPETQKRTLPLHPIWLVPGGFFARKVRPSIPLLTFVELCAHTLSAFRAVSLLFRREPQLIKMCIVPQKKSHSRRFEPNPTAGSR